MDRTGVNRAIILLIVVLVSVIFLAMIRQFLMAILLAGIFSAMAQPLYRRIERFAGGRSSLASTITLAAIFLIIILPLAGLLGIVAGQAVRISHSVSPFIQQWMNTPSAVSDLVRSWPLFDTFSAYQGTILQKAGELVGVISSFLFQNVSTLTFSTINFIFLFFVFLYTMFFFLKEGRRILERFTSVARAAIKGTLVIGVIQGGLAGIAFWAVGFESALFWGTIMTVLSIIPAVGSALVWFPAVLILAFTGSYFKALGLFAFCAVLVGSVDNILRPWLVGRDTELHELMIFFGTLGGIGMFGITGFIIGPIIAALFSTVWDIYAEHFSDYLPDTGPVDGPPA
jgi:predicted PurR-regulated permease PerM